MSRAAPGRCGPVACRLGIAGLPGAGAAGLGHRGGRHGGPGDRVRGAGIRPHGTRLADARVRRAGLSSIVGGGGGGSCAGFGQEGIDPGAGGLAARLAGTGLKRSGVLVGPAARAVSGPHILAAGPGLAVAVRPDLIAFQPGLLAGIGPGVGLVVQPGPVLRAQLARLPVTGPASGVRVPLSHARLPRRIGGVRA